jgi:hypothetical protein
MRKALMFLKKAKVKNNLFNKPNVVWVGRGYKHVGGKATREPCVVVGVTQKKDGLSAEDMVPPVCDGLKTDVIELGVPRLVVGSGDGVGPAGGGTGTITCWVKDELGRDFVMSNLHVLGSEGGVFQPNSRRGIEVGRVWNYVPVLPVLSRLSRSDRDLFVGLRVLYKIGATFQGFYRKLFRISDPINLCDAAVALVTNHFLPSREILGVGRIQGVGQATVGAKVTWKGVTSGVQTGEVLAVDGKSALDFQGARCAFGGVFLVGGQPANYGDSGALVMDEAGLAVGMVFAAGRLTLCLPIDRALKELGVTLKV